MIFKSPTPILLYHKVCKFDPSGTWVTPRQFEKQMKYLNDNGYNTITPYQLVETQCLASPDVKPSNVETQCFASPKMNPKNVIITFDDGYEDFYTYAYPVMLKYNFKAVIFAISSYVGKDNSWDVNWGVKKRLMNLDQLKEIQKHGFIIGSHTDTHAELTRIPVERVKKELTSSKQNLEQMLGAKVDFISFPFGSYNENIINVARESGYKFSFVSNPFAKGEDVLGRMAIYIIDTLLDFKFKLNKENKIPYWYEGVKGRVINAFSHGTWLWKTISRRLSLASSRFWADGRAISGRYP